MVSTEVLELILAARYIGRPAFNALSQDIEGVVQQSNALSRVGAAFSALGDLMITAGVGVGVGLAAAVKQAAEFEQSMQRIQTVTGYTPDQMKNLQQTIMDLSDQYGQSSQDIGQASYLVLSGVQALGAGYQDVMSNKILPAIAAYVEASGAGQLGSVSWTTAAQNVTTILAGLHQPLTSWTNDLGDLTMVENNAHTTQQNLVQSMLRFAPMAGLLNMPFDQTAAIAGALATAGVPGARAGTDLTSGFRTLVSGKGASATQLAQFGLTPESFFGQNGQIDDLQGIMGILMPHLAGLNTGQRIGALNNLFGAPGGRAFNELLTNSTNGGPSAMAIYQTLLGKEQNAPGGAANAMFGEAAGIASGPQATFDKLKASLQNLAIIVGQQLLPTLQQWATWLIDHIKTLTDFIQKNPQVVGEVAKAVPALIGGGIGMKALGGAFSFLGSPAGKTGLTMAGKLFGHVGLVGEGPLQEGQFRSSGLLGLLQRLVGGGGSVGHNAFEAVKGGGKGIGRFLMAHQEPVGKTPEELGAGLTSLIEGHKTKGLKALSEHFPTAMANMFMEKGPMGSGHPALGFLGGAAKDVGGMAKGGIGNMFGGLAGGIKNLITGIPALLGMLPELAAGFAVVAIPVMVIIGIIAILVLTFLTFRHEAMETGATIGKQLSPIFKLFAGVFQTAVKSIEKAWNAAWPSIQKAMMSLFANLPKIVPLLQLVGGIIGGVFAIIAAVIVGVVNGVIKALPFIIGFISSIISFVGDFIKIIFDLFTNWNAIPGDLQNLWNDILGIFKNAALMLWNLVLGIIQGIIGFFEMLWNKLTKHSIIPDMINDIINWFLKLPSQLGQLVLNLINNLINLLKSGASNIITGAETIGNSIITGITNGINNLLGNLKNTVTNAASSAIGWFKNVLGIHSPSTVFTEIGSNVVMGYIIGLQSQQSAVQSAWSNIVVPSSSAGTMPGPINVNVSGGGASTGMHPSQASYSGALAVQQERYNRQSNVQNITQSSLLRQIDLQYRYAYQASA